MKIDKFLEKQLINYADGIEPDKALLKSALLQLEKNNANRRRMNDSGKSLVMFKNLVAVAASFALIVISIAIIYNAVKFFGNTGTGGTPLNYSLSSLEYRPIEFDSVEDLTGYGIYLSDSIEVISAKSLIHPGTGEVVVNAVKCRVLGEYKIDFEIYVDIEEGLWDFRSFKSNDLRMSNKGKSFNIITEYKDGEYYSNIYVKVSNYDYYIISMSSVYDSGKYLIDNYF